MKKKKKLRLKRPFQLILAALLFLLAFSFFQLIKNQFKQENKLVSTQVLNYEDLMLKYARENDIEEYLGLLQAMMMQESGGQGNDPMHLSECEFNTYALQLGIYGFMNEILTKKKCKGLLIFWLDMNTGNSEVIPTNFMKHEIILMLNHYKKNINTPQ